VDSACGDRIFRTKRSLDGVYAEFSEALEMTENSCHLYVNSELVYPDQITNLGKADCLSLGPIRPFRS